MRNRKFKNEDEFNIELNKIDRSLMYENFLESFIDHKNLVYHQTKSLKQAQILMELAKEKINEHNGECKRIVTGMKGKAYKRNNIEGYKF
jgi:hypothetical protein